MLRPVDLGRLTQHRGPTLGNEQVDGDPERRIGGDAAVPVGAAALKTQHEAGRRDLDAPGRGRGRQEFAERRETCLHGAADPALLLDHEHGRPLDLAGAPQVLALDQSTRLGDLAAEAHDDVAAHVGMPREPREDALELQVLRAVRRHAASALVRQREHAVHRRVCGQLVGSHPVRDETAHRCRAVGHADDGHVVARAHAPVGADIAKEGALAGAHVRGSRWWISGSRKGIRPIERADGAVVAVTWLPAPMSRVATPIG